MPISVLLAAISVPADGGVYTVQREWSNERASCVGAAGLAVSVSGPDAGILDPPAVLFLLLSGRQQLPI